MKKPVRKTLVRQGKHVGYVESTKPWRVVGTRAPALAPVDGDWHVVKRPDPSKRSPALYFVERRTTKRGPYQQIAASERTATKPGAALVLAYKTPLAAGVVCLAMNAARGFEAMARKA